MALGKLSDRASDSALSPSVTKPSNGSSNGGKTFQFLKKLRMSTFGFAVVDENWSDEHWTFITFSTTTDGYYNF